MTSADLSSTKLSRRNVLTTGSTLMALALGAPRLYAQAASTLPEDRLAALAGFPVLPRDLVSALIDRLEDETLSRLSDQSPLPADLRKRLLNALYTGVLSGVDEDTPAERIGFSSAMMWAALEETNNVISYCGGVPGYWADPPEST